ncbi:MAG: hypothetical protein ACOX5G_12355 [Kiritimatiellia bacterium]|jgi:hypothetical protein
MKKTFALLLAAVCAAVAAAADFTNPVSIDNLDPEAFCEWDPGAEPRERTIPNEPRNAIWTRERMPEWAGIAFAGSKTPGTRHLRVAFKEPVDIGSVLARGALRVSVLKPDAAYPGDLADETQWIPAGRLDVGGTTSDEPGARDAVTLWTLPSVISTRAIRYTHEAASGANEYHGALGISMAFSERWANFSRVATAAAKSNNSMAGRILDGCDNSWNAWENANREQAGNRLPVSEDPEWLVAYWPSEIPLDAILTVWTGFGSADVQVYAGPESLHPLDASDAGWKSVAAAEGFQSGYPVQLWPCIAGFESAATTRAVRLRLTGPTPVGHPHVMDNTVDGKRVWLGELFALHDLGDAPLAAPAFEKPDDIHPPIPVEFTTPADGFVTLVIEKEDGTRVRNLVSDAPFPKGRNVAWWDGSDDLLRDEDAQNHGLWHIPTRFVEPGTYRVRGLWHAAIDARYEFAVYAPGNPPWDVPDHTGAWLANHSAPQSAAFVPAGRSPTAAPAVFLGAYVTEGPDGLIWTDLDATKRGGLKWLGGHWTAAPFLAHDAGPEADPGISVYAAAAWTEGTNPTELRLTALRNNGRGWLDAAGVFNGPFNPFLAADRAPTNRFDLGSIAAWNRNVYVSVPALDVVARVDASGAVADFLGLPSPRGLAMEADGTLLVVAGNRVVRVAPAADGALAGAKADVVVAGGFADPQYLATGPDGAFYVSDWGDSHQVKSFAKDGTPGRVFGHAGAPAAGPYDELHMNCPAGLAVDSEGQLWVAECDYVPKRVSVWSIPDGSLQKAVYGPAKYGGGGSLAMDNANRFVYADENRGTLEFDIDWKTGGSRLVNVPYRAVPNDLVHRIGCAAPEHVFTRKRRRYYSNTYNSSPVAGSPSVVLFQERDGIAVPIAAFGNANWGYLLKNETFADCWPPRDDSTTEPDRSFQVPAFFLWVDRNGDADVQPGEIQMRRGGVQGVNVMEDLSFAISRIDSTAYRLRPRSIDRAGVPDYSLEDLETVATNVYWAYSSGGGQMLCDDSDEAVVTLGVQPFSPYSVTGVKDGKAVWSIPNPWPGLHASHNCDVPTAPGQLIGVTRMMNGFFEPKKSKVGPLWAVNANMGNFYILTRDGLFVTTVFHDVRTAPLWRMPTAERGMPVGHLSLHDENFWPSLTCLPNGRTYIVNSGCIVRLDGLETLRPIKPFTVEVTPERIQASIEFENRREALRRAAQGSGVMRARILDTAPAVDGDLADWQGASFVEIVKAGMGANFNSDSRPYHILGAVAASGDRLYAAWDTAERHLLRNSGEMPNALFKTGGALDLMIAADPEADPNRTEPVPGDKRLLVTRVGDTVRALLYTAVVPGTPDDAKVPFSSPWRTITFDRVEDVGDRIELADNGRGAFELSVPLAVLGITPKAGQAQAADIGVLRGDGSTTSARLYWSNKSTGITADVPSEAQLQPGFWGKLVWE